MPWIEYTGPFDWYPRPANRRHHVAYKPGHCLLATSALAAAAIAAGAAVRIKTPSKAEAEAIRANGNRRPT